MTSISTNERAFLGMIRHSEGTDRAPDPYRVCFGYWHTIADLSDHPAVTGEWRGEPLSDAICRGACLMPGCRSTAAGAYQIIRPTWRDAKAALQLPDFGPDSQDRAALLRVAQRGAADAVRAGRLDEAVALCAHEWASLPGSTAGQRTVALAALMTAYRAAGGALA